MKKIVLFGTFVVFTTSLGMETKITKIIDVGAATSKIRMHYQEDTSRLFNKDKVSIFAVFDGHNGDDVSTVLKDLFHSCLCGKIKDKSCTITSLSEVFAEMENYIQIGYENDAVLQGGSTASVACFHNDKLIVGNVGDSRLIIGNRDGTVSFATKDHKPALELGKRLTDDQISWDSWAKIHRLKNSNLAVSRVLGDIDLKKKDSALIATPDCNEISLEENNNCIILGSDGLYDVMSNEEVVKLTNDGIKDNKSAQEIAKMLLHKAIEKNSVDNTSIIVIRLGASEKQFDFKNLQVVSYDNDKETQLLIQQAQQLRHAERLKKEQLYQEVRDTKDIKVEAEKDDKKKSC